MNELILLGIGITTTTFILFFYFIIRRIRGKNRSYALRFEKIKDKFE